MATADPIEQFIEAWQRNDCPDVDSFVLQASSKSVALSLLILNVRQRIRRGLPVALEGYLSRYRAIANDPEACVDLIYSEYLLREELGESPSIHEYESRFPEYSPLLRRQIEFHRQLSDTDCVGTQSEDWAKWSNHLPGALVGGIPGYRIFRMIGQGSSSVVFEALQERLERRVALKVLRFSDFDEEGRYRFRNEAIAAAQIEHPNVVAIYDVNEHRRYPYLALEYMPGGTLFEALRGKPWQAEASARLVRLLALALQAAHERGVIHRDLKPTNILIRDPLTIAGDRLLDDTHSASGIKIADFGLAKILTDTSAHNWTLAGDVLGTPSYMAPEQSLGRNDEVGPAADIYSLGAILYELLVGRPPFRGATAIDTLVLASTRTPTPPTRLVGDVPRDLETICLKCLEKAPAERYSSASALASDLQRYLEHRPIAARPPSYFGVGWKWCKRNPTVAILAVTLLLALTCGLLGALWQWGRAESARAGEYAARQEAEKRTLEVTAGVNRFQLANELLELGHTYLPAGRWDDADAAFGRAIRSCPELAVAWEARGEQLYARLGLWDLAAQDCHRAFQLKKPSLPDRWRWTALLLAYAKDLNSYRDVCFAMQEQNVKGAFELKHNLIRTLALVPDAETPSEDLLRHADALVAAYPDRGLFAYTQAIARLRAGRFDLAIDSCQRSLSLPGHFCPELNYPILALAHHRLGHAARARRSLQAATDALDGWLEERCQQPAESWVINLGATGLPSDTLWDRLECEIYVREAQNALGPSTARVEPRLHLLRARSFAGLRQFEQADEEYSAAIALLPNDREICCEAFRNRGYLCARRGEFASSADAFANARLIRHDDVRLLEFEAYAHIAAGEIDAYKRLCHESMELFGDTLDPETAHCVVDICTLRQDSLSDFSCLRRLGCVGASWYAGGVRVLGAVNYRAGEFSEAIRCIEEGHALGSLRPSDLAFMAMAYNRLGDMPSARKCLDHVRSWIVQANNRDLNEPAHTEPSWGAWHERISVGILVDEAESLLAASTSN